MGGVESIDAVQPIVCLLAARLHGPGSPEGGGANVRITSRRRANASCGDVTVPIVTCETGWVAGEAYRGGPRNSDRLLRWDPDPGEGVWNATEETELSG